MKQLNCISYLLFISLLMCSCDIELNYSPVDDVFEQANGETRSIRARTRSNPSSTGNKWAIIISGGGTTQSNYYRYWNDCSFFYSTLKNVYGLSDSQIKVAMSDGMNIANDYMAPNGLPESSPWDLDGDGVGDIDCFGNRAGVLSALGDVSANVEPGDEVIIFVTNRSSSLIYPGEGIPLWLWGNESMTASEFREALEDFSPEVTKHIILGQEYSGFFASFLHGLKQTTITASGVFGGMPTSDYEYTEFLYHWTAAIAGEYPDGSTADADANSDGVITLREAFNYAEANDMTTEEPLFYEYKNLFGNIPIMYPYPFQEPYVTGPVDVNRGSSYTYTVKNYTPGLNSATLVSNSDFTVVSSSDSTIVVSVNSAGGLKHGPVTFNLTSSGTNFWNSNSSVDDVLIWQTGTFTDDLGAIETYYSFPNCDAHLLPRFSLVSNGFYWNTVANNWTILRRRIPDALFQFTGGIGNEPNELAISLDITNPFGNTTTLTKTIDLTE